MAFELVLHSPGNIEKAPVALDRRARKDNGQGEANAVENHKDDRRPDPPDESLGDGATRDSSVETEDGYLDERSSYHVVDFNSQDHLIPVRQGRSIWWRDDSLGEMLPAFLVFDPRRATESHIR